MRTLGGRLEGEAFDARGIGALPARHAESEIVQGLFRFRSLDRTHCNLIEHTSRPEYPARNGVRNEKGFLSF
jgi:hypothetical protein